MKDLPKKLSELLRVGLDDLAWAESKPDQFKIFMPYLVNRGAPNELCSVCMAGAVMVHSLDVALPELGQVSPNELGSKQVEWTLSAINSLRQGDVKDAAIYLDIVLTEAQKDLDRAIFPYEDDGKGWRADMEQLYSDLVEAEL